jgi:hypothetical protein
VYSKDTPDLTPKVAICPKCHQMKQPGQSVCPNCSTRSCPGGHPMSSTAKICNLCGWLDPNWKTIVQNETKVSRAEQASSTQHARYYQCPYCNYKFSPDQPPPDIKSMRCPNAQCSGLFNGEEHRISLEEFMAKKPIEFAEKKPEPPKIKAEVVSMKAQDRERIKETIIARQEREATSIETSKDRKHFRRELKGTREAEHKAVVSNSVKEFSGKEPIKWGAVAKIASICLMVLLVGAGVFFVVSNVMNSRPNTTSASTPAATSTPPAVASNVPAPAKTETKPPVSTPTATPPATTPAGSLIIQTPAVTSITDTSAVITWVTNQPSTTQVDWGNTWQCGTLTNINIELSLNHSASLTGLRAGTTYYYKVISTTKDKIAMMQDSQKFDTLPPPDVTPPVINHVLVAETSDSTASITWKTDENASSQIEYGGSTSYGQSTNLDKTLKTDHSVKLEGLTPATVYHFRVKSADKYGNPGVSADFSLTTKDLIPTGYAEGNRAQDFTLNKYGGQPVTLSSLRGKTVMLTFWHLG